MPRLQDKLTESAIHGLAGVGRGHGTGQHAPPGASREEVAITSPLSSPFPDSKLREFMQKQKLGDIKCIYKKWN